MSNTSSLLIGVSSWALHHELGAPPIFGVHAGDSVPTFTPQNARLSLLELPAELARQGFDSLQICHFHLPSRDAGYLAELRGAIEKSGLQLHALLVDEGDLTHPQTGARDEAWIGGWFQVAAQLGAQNVRVIAGKTVGDGALERSATALRALISQADALNLGVLIENWFDLLASPTDVLELLERCDGGAQLLLDFGNWSGASRLENLAAIAPRAVACHARADFLRDGRLDETDFAACLRLPYAPEFCGPFVLVNGGLSGIGALRDFIMGIGEHWNNK